MNIATKLSYRFKKMISSNRVVYRNFTQAFSKTMAVINSCNTQEEIEVAERMVNCFENMFSYKKDMVSALHSIAHARKKMIKRIEEGREYTVSNKILVR